MEVIVELDSVLEKVAIALVLGTDDIPDSEVDPALDAVLEKVAMALLLIFAEEEPVLLVALADDSETKLEDAPSDKVAEVTDAVALALVRLVSADEDDGCGYVTIVEDSVTPLDVNGMEPVDVAVPIGADEEPIHWHAL